MPVALLRLRAANPFCPAPAHAPRKYAARLRRPNESSLRAAPRRHERIRSEEEHRAIGIATHEREVPLVHVAGVDIRAPIPVQERREQCEPESIFRDALNAHRSVAKALQVTLRDIR